ncbi:MAG: polymer-forming cytoskeletal protein [Bacteroidales bacterium]|jgi:cytoskeletal protein CcmA (bactofilin family)|nr:polymer-forming cytoskeletal protein [Bacteroidales bacterium]
MAKYIEEQPNLHNTITNGTEIVGDINSNGDIRLDGSLKGNLTVKGKVVIGPTGTMEGTVVCKNSDIFGKMEGKLKVSELLALKSSANVKGDIVANKLSIEPGCKFTGTCVMDSPAEKQEKVETPIKTA